MAVLTEKTVVCPACGHEFQTHVLVSSHVSRSPDLDTYRPDPGRWVRFRLCPSCGFSYFRDEPFTEGMKRSMESGRYRRVLQSRSLPLTPKNTILSAFIEEDREDFNNAGFCYMFSYWYFREKGREDRFLLLRKACSCFEKHLENKADPSLSLVLADLYRQDFAFSEALAVIERTDAVSSADDVLRKIAEYEVELIAAGDSGTHTVREALCRV